MTKNELVEFIENTTVNVMNNNIDYINEHHMKELENSNEPISRVFQSFLHTAINLSTLTTLKTLEEMGVLSLPKD